MGSIDLKAIRERLGETQTEFGKRFGVKQPTIHRWENGELPDSGPARLLVDQFVNDMAKGPSDPQHVPAE